MIQSFIEAVGGGDELNDSVGVYFVLLFLYRFGFFLVFNTLLCVFVLMVIRHYLRMLVLISILKMVLMVMNCCRFLILCALFYLGFKVCKSNQQERLSLIKHTILFIAKLNSYCC